MPSGSEGGGGWGRKRHHKQSLSGKSFCLRTRVRTGAAFVRPRLVLSASQSESTKRSRSNGPQLPANALIPVDAF